MAKISPVSIKYMIHANFSAEGALEKPDIIGAIFGQTEGLLGADLEMRELQKEGKIGRIEVDSERKERRTMGLIKIPTALDQSETTLIAAAVETIDRIGPCDAAIEIEKIEDVRGSKRDYIIDRAKKLMGQIEGSTDSREISNTIKDAARIAGVQEYGKSKLPFGNLSDKELIVVEGRADVLNLLRAGVKNVIAMNGTKLPPEIKELSKEKDIVLFVDGDRGGKLIAQNVVDNANVKSIAAAPDGKEVEELMGKEILTCLRKKFSPREFLSMQSGSGYHSKTEAEPRKEVKIDREQLKKISDDNQGSGRAILLDSDMNEIKKISAKTVGSSLKRGDDIPSMIVIDGNVTNAIINSAENAGVQVIAAKNFSATSEKIKLLSL